MDTWRVHKGQPFFLVLGVGVGQISRNLIHSRSMHVGQTMGDVRKADACWNLMVDVIKNVQSSLYYLYCGE